MLDSIPLVGPVRLLHPEVVWLLVIPGAIGALWGWRYWQRRRDARRYVLERTTPGRERYPLTGALAGWLCVIGALVCVVLAVARPQARVSLVQSAGIDFVILQDGSTSMRVGDVTPDRWQRSTAWLRTFAEALSWSQERVALALFAYRPAPQVRLTSDPNAFFFFLDYLQDEPPFRLEDDTSWDTNIQEGLHWGLRMFELDEELYGRRRSAKAFIVISDGQDWGEEVGTAIARARDYGARVYVIGVGTTAGGIIPDVPPQRYREPYPAIHSALDRQSLRAIATAGGGQYHELGTDRDDAIALRILSDVQQRAEAFQRDEVFQDLYWPLLCGAGFFLCVGAGFVRDRTEQWWQLAVVVAVVIFLL